MPQTTFAYKVRDSSGKVLEGTLEADNTSLVASRLRQMGYTPVNIEAKNGNVAKKELHLPGMGSRVPLKELAVFSRQFATSDHVGLDAHSGAYDPGRADGAPGLAQSYYGRASSGGARRFAVSRSRLPPEGLQPSVYRHGQSR